MLLCVQARQTAIGSRERMHTTLQSTLHLSLPGLKSSEVRQKKQELIDPPVIQISLEGTDGWAIQRRKVRRGACVSWVWHLQLSLHGLSSFLLQLEIRIWLNCRPPSQTCSSRPLEMAPRFRDGREQGEGWVGVEGRPPNLSVYKYGAVCLSWWKLEGGGCRDVTVDKQCWNF
jgi:hypothetical protein